MACKRQKIVAQDTGEAGQELALLLSTCSSPRLSTLGSGWLLKQHNHLATPICFGFAGCCESDWLFLRLKAEGEPHLPQIQFGLRLGL